MMRLLSNREETGAAATCRSSPRQTSPQECSAEIGHCQCSMSVARSQCAKQLAPQREAEVGDREPSCSPFVDLAVRFS